MEKFILEKEQTILMIIDIQDRLIKVMDDGEKVMNNTNILISIANELNIPILITEQYPKGLGHTVIDIKNNIDKNVMKATVYEKNSFSGYTKDVSDKLKSLGKQKIIITGMETHICVFQTVRDLLYAGYDVFIAKDAVCSRFLENYNNGLSLMKEMGAVITNTETVLFDLLKEAGTSQFKSLSKLIK